MKIKNLLSKASLAFFVIFSTHSQAATPVASFSIGPQPFCSGNTYTITDLSSNVPTAWSYTVRGGGGPGATNLTLTAQNPTVAFTGQGVFTISLIASNSSGASSVVSQTIAVLPSPNANIAPANPNTCIGIAVNVSVTAGGGPGGGGALTYNWSTGSTSSLITVSPSVTTTYSCVISSTNGCSVVRSTTVTVGNPTVNITSVPASICPGTTCTLTVNGTGPGPKTYTWSNATNGNVLTSSVAGVFSATMTNAQGCTGVQTITLGTSTTLSLTAGSTPSALCSGNTGTLNVTGAANYTWSNGSTVSNPTINPTSNSTYTVYGEIGTCTGSAVVTLSVSVLPTITVVSNPASICAGASATLNASGAGSYTWTPGNITTSSIVVTPGSNTSYTVRGVNTGCPPRNGTLALTVAPTPVINIFASSTLACAGEALALSVFGGNTYTWSTGSNANVLIVYPTTVTPVYTVIGTNNSNCSATASITLNVSDCTGLMESLNNKNGLSIYPNPAKAFVIFKTDSDLAIEIRDLTGRLVKNLLLENGTEIILGLNDLTSGVYFVKSYNNGKVYTQKLIVE
ncbi:MAG: T9SS type A sorting domain-containing protein [Bacteroidia bacterium]|nr:T9SS type A sorting domain-containing protein [Bacteroidia bacterium]